MGSEDANRWRIGGDIAVAGESASTGQDSRLAGRQRQDAESKLGKKREEQPGFPSTLSSSKAKESVTREKNPRERRMRKTEVEELVSGVFSFSFGPLEF
ncbi:hypothetical protein R1flu_002926 [Riccia fluitans]|uniref:Uncharacterized protein n=1 Tax=Riccia fluitans TaxID=41844 RepID=A0ABD1Y7L4_9MARC